MDGVQIREGFQDNKDDFLVIYFMGGLFGSANIFRLTNVAYLSFTNFHFLMDHSASLHLQSRAKKSPRK